MLGHIQTLNKITNNKKTEDLIFGFFYFKITVWTVLISYQNLNP